MRLLLVFICIVSVISASAQIKFDDYFISKSMRVDYTHAGDTLTENIYLEQIKQEPFWGGSKINIIDKFDYGTYKLCVYDSSSKKLIYSRGYCTLFEEWRTTDEAKKTKKSFYETITFPYPLKTVKIEIHARNRKNNRFAKLYEVYINPVKNYYIISEMLPRYSTEKILYNGPADKKLDVVIIPEGYRQNDMKKFNKDAQRLTDFLFGYSPFKESKNKFNIWKVNAPSQEKGVDNPGLGIFKNTAVNATFYALGSDRYLMTYDMKSVRDIAACVPYDQIIILVNTETYGGGGIFNYYSCASADNLESPFVFVHEFGHSFGGLTDEYYTSEVTYVEFFNLKVEPWQPNITTMVHFDTKWKSMIEPGVPIPTPATEKYKDKVGAFEGGGYVAKGVYRPVQDCSMKSNISDGFCPVCKKALTDMINFYCE